MQNSAKSVLLSGRQELFSLEVLRILPYLKLHASEKEENLYRVQIMMNVSLPGLPDPKW